MIPLTRCFSILPDGHPRRDPIPNPEPIPRGGGGEVGEGPAPLRLCGSDVRLCVFLTMPGCGFRLDYKQSQEGCGMVLWLPRRRSRAGPSPRLSRLARLRGIRDDVSWDSERTQVASLRCWDAGFSCLQIATQNAVLVFVLQMIAGNLPARLNEEEIMITRKEASLLPAVEAYTSRPSHDQRGMLRPFGTSSADLW